jgi:hypothetical protein
MRRDELVAAVDAAVRARDGREERGEVRFRCVAHDDEHPSARWHRGKACWHCDACGVGGGVVDLGRRLGLEVNARNGAGRERVWTLRDASGSVVAEHVRVDVAGRKRMWWRLPDGTRGLGGRRTRDLPLYAVERLAGAAPGALVVLAEGERATDALLARGIAAVGTVTGAAGTPSDDVLRALVGRDVALWPDADEPGRAHMTRIAGRLAALGVAVRWYDPAPDGADGSDAADDERDAETLRAALATAPAWRAEAGGATATVAADATIAPAPRASRESTADALVKLGLERLELWHDADGVPYASLGVGGHVEHHALRASAVRHYLARAYFVETRRSARTDSMSEALATLEGLARYDGDEHRVAVRVAASRDGDAIYLDLADAAWRAVEVTPTGWRVLDRCPIRFRRPRGLRALPEPVPAGSVDDLRAVLPAVGDDERRLIVAWLLAALRPVGPYPVLCLHGEAGAAKSTTARLLRSLVDPARPPLRSAPRDDRDLVIAATNGHVVALDNLSHVPSWLSDGLCRLSTGGGYATRTLYTDTDETLLDVQRPAILTGIEELAVRGDLADRALVVTLPAIADEDRVTEAQLTARVDAARPRVLGALLDAVATGLRELPHARLARLPRLADAALWWTACEAALPWERGSILAAHDRGRGEAAATTLEASPVGAALLALLALHQGYGGTAGELLEALGAYAPEAVVRDRHRWPQSPRGLAGALRRLAPALRRAGWAVDHGREAGTGGRRLVRIARATVATVATVADPDLTGGGCDGRPGDDPEPSPRPSHASPRPDGVGDGCDGRDGTCPHSSREPGEDDVEWEEGEV